MGLLNFLTGEALLDRYEQIGGVVKNELLLALLGWIVLL